MPPKAFLFDLDQTLVDSAALADARRSGDWAHVRANMHLVRPFGGATPAHTVPGQLRGAGFRIGIVTSSPRSYAEEVLQRFGLRLGVEYDALIAYHDTTNHKPHPDPINAALAALAVPSSEACHVGDQADDHVASYLAGVRSIGAGWGVPDPLEPSRAPDVLVRDPALLLDPHVADRGGYLAEMMSSGVQPLTHPGAVFPCGPRSVVALGRYFTTGDPRHAPSSLVANLLGLKNDDGPAAILGRALGEYVHHLAEKPQYIVPVPPKPGQRNRFEAVLEHAKPWLAGVLAYPDGLSCTKLIEGYKSMGADQRRAAVSGAYVSKYTWRGCRVLLIDDIHTTDSTTAECASVLLAAQAGEVWTVALGKDQRSFSPPRMCPRCGSQLRQRRSAYGPFWGCTGWRRDDSSSCQYTEDAS